MATQSSSDPTDDRTINSSAEQAAAESATSTMSDQAAPAPSSPERLSGEPTTPEPTTEEHTASGSMTSEQPILAPVATTSTHPSATETSASAQPTVVYVQAPQPPRNRGARGVGALVALLGAGVFAAAYALLVLLIALIGSPAGFAPAFQFLASSTFYVPVIVFFLAYLLLIVVINRAGWWAHVLGGFVVALITWVGFVGAAIIAAGAFGGSASEVGSVVLQQLTNPLGFAAAIAAREVPIWVGGLVSRRGRTARARNAEARAAYERELADHRATIGANTAV